eukprot:Skav212958  [mRNA]  locus=scaffold3901:38687:41155:+ [translate_table: standard]
MADTTAVPVHEHVALQEEEEFIEKVQGSSATEVAEGATETKHHDVSGSQVPGSQLTDEAGPQDGSADKHPAAPHAAGEVAGSSATEVPQSSAEGATETKHHDVAGSQVPGSQLTDEAGPQDGSADKHPAAPHAAGEVAGSSATEVPQSSAEGATETKHHDVAGSQVPGSQLTDEAGPQDGSADKHPAAPHAAGEVAGSSATEVPQSSAEGATETKHHDVAGSQVPGSQLTDEAGPQDGSADKHPAAPHAEVAGNSATKVAQSSSEGATETKHHDVSGSQVPGSQLTDEAGPQDGSADKHSAAPHAEEAGSSATEVAQSSAEGATETKHQDVAGSQVPGSQLTDEAGPQDGSADKHSAAPHAEEAGSSATEVAQSSAEGATETKHQDVAGSQVPGSQLTDEAGPQDGSADKHSAAPHAEEAGSSATEVAQSSAEGATETKHQDVAGSQVPGSQLTDEAGPQDGSADKHSAAPHAEEAGSSATEVAQSSAEGATETKHQDVAGSQVPGSQLTDEAGPQDGSADKHSAAPHAEEAGSSATEVAQSSAEGATETKHQDVAGSQVPGSQLTDEAGPQDGSADKHSAAPHAEVAGSSATEVAQSSAEEASKEENDKDQISGMVETQSDGIAAIPTQQGVEDVQAPGVPLAGESEHLEETLLEALEKKNEENEENDTAEASESGAPKYRFGWWRLSRVAPEPDFEVRHVVHYKDGVQMGPARLERRRQRSGYQQTSTVPTLTPHYNPTGEAWLSLCHRCSLMINFFWFCSALHVWSHCCCFFNVSHSRAAEHETQPRMYIRTGSGKDLWILSRVRVSHHNFPDAYMLVS